MGFLAPWFLAGAAAVALPVWLHLLRRHRSTLLPFSSLMFFERRTQSSIKHRKLRYLLLFALRSALLILIALAFAEPYLESRAAGGAAGSKLLVLAVDNSFSMRQGERLERARREAAALAAHLGSGSRGQVIEFASAVRLLTQPEQDAAALRAAIQSIRPSDARSSFGELARALRAIAESARQPLEVHLFSDMQRTSLPPSFTDLRLPAGTRLALHPAASERLPNWSVESVLAPRALYSARKARVRATIAAFGGQPARKPVSLVVNGRTLETKEVEAPANGRATLEFTSLEAPHGANRAEVRVESGDAFPADDGYLFAVERADPHPVLFVHEERERRAALYFRAALEASAESAFRLEEVAAERTADVSPAKYAFVVLSDVGWLPARFQSALSQYVEGGGAVWISLGPSAAASTVPVLGTKLVRDPAGERGWSQMVSYLDEGHPSVRQAARWEGVKFYQALRVDAADARVVARLADGTPVLIEKKVGEGRVLVFASTFDNISNDFPLHASFVPFVGQTAAYLGGVGESGGAFLVGSFVPLRSARERGTAIEVIGPDGGRALSLQEATTAQALALAQRGYYEIRRANGRHEMVAVNPDPRESDFDLIPAETLKLWQNAGEGGAASSSASAGAQRRRLWPYVLLAALVVALSESVVGNRHLAIEREAA